MPSQALIRRFGEISLLLVVPTLFAGLVAAADDNWSLVAGLLTSAGVLTLPGLVFRLMITADDNTSDQPSSIILVLLFWVFFPIVWIPTVLSFTGDGRVLTAYFDVVSCLTTTGAMVGQPRGMDLPYSYFFWRSTLHIIGAVAVLASVILVFSNLNSTGPGVQRSRRFRVSPERSFAKMWPIVSLISATVIGFTILVFFALVITGIEFGDAWNLAVSTTTTGMVDPSNSYEDIPATSLLVLTFSWVLAAVNITMIVGLITLNFDRRIDQDSVVFLSLVIFATSIFVGANIPDATPIQKVAQAASVASTSGVVVLPSAGLESLLVPILVFSFIGGTALSTAGGVKISRLIVLGARTGLEFRTLGHPQSVEQFSYRGEHQPTTVILAVWVYLIAFSFAAIGLTGLLSALGFDGVDAMSLSVGAMSNSGALIALVDPTTISDAGKLLMAIGMLVGRLEILMILSALRVDFWQR